MYACGNITGELSKQMPGLTAFPLQKSVSICMILQAFHLTLFTWCYIDSHQIIQKKIII